MSDPVQYNKKPTDFIKGSILGKSTAGLPIEPEEVPATTTPGTKTRKAGPEAVAAAVATKDMTPAQIGQARLQAYRKGLSDPTPTEANPVTRELYPERVAKERREFYEGRVGLDDAGGAVYTARDQAGRVISAPSEKSVTIQDRAPLKSVGELSFYPGPGTPADTKSFHAGQATPSSYERAQEDVSMGVARLPFPPKAEDQGETRSIAKKRLYVETPPLAGPWVVQDNFMLGDEFVDFGRLQQVYQHMSIPLLTRYHGVLDKTRSGYVEDMAREVRRIQKLGASTVASEIDKQNAAKARLTRLREETAKINESSNQALQTLAHLNKMSELFGFDIELAEETKTAEDAEQAEKKAARAAEREESS